MIAFAACVADPSLVYVPDAGAADAGDTGASDAGTCTCPEPPKPEPWQVVKANCDRTYDKSPFVWATIELPGRSAEDLARSTVRYCLTTSDGIDVYPFNCKTRMDVVTQTGKLNFACRMASGAVTFESVTFIIPPTMPVASP